MKALFIDTRERRLPIYSVSVTKVGDEERRMVVLRMGAEVGTLHDVEGFYFDAPVLVATNGYQARSSAGFVEVTNYKCHPQHHANVVGLCGFPNKSGKIQGLKVLGDPVNCVVLGKGQVRRVTGMANSNSATAEAAIEGLRVRSSMTGKLLVIEGQSDRATGFVFEASLSDPETGSWYIGLPCEHRDRFSPPELLHAALRRQAAISVACAAEEQGGEDGGKEERSGVVLILATLLAAGISGAIEKYVPWLYAQILGQELADFADGLASSEYFRGWKITVDRTLGNRFIQAVTPDGKVAAQGWGLCHMRREDIARVLPLLDLTEEEKEEEAASLNSQSDTDRAQMSMISA